MGIQQGTDRSLRELALFAGAGGGILGGYLLGWQTVCAVEFDPYARDVLLARQNDGCLPPFPVWDDARTFDGRPWRGAVDVVSGGFPCQDISSAGKGAGISGERSGLWREMARIIGEVQPRFVWVENSPMLVGRGLGLVLLDLAKMGFSARWGIVGACDVGAPHQRKRLWIVGYPASFRQPEGCERLRQKSAERSEHPGTWNGRRVDQPGIERVVDGMAGQMDRLRCTGNGQVPAVVRLAWNTLNSYTDSPKGTASHV